MDVAVIDLTHPREAVVKEVATAASTVGFFQIINHGIASELTEHVWRQTHLFFAQPVDTKRTMLRTKEISRGYYDRELTKNKRDQKEVFDFATVPFGHLPHDHPNNFASVDGHNQWPNTQSHPQLHAFQEVMMQYLAACETVARDLLAIFAEGMDQEATSLHDHFGADNTSFIRLNHYPTTDVLSADEAAEVTALGDMALHHHTDAGAFTLLLQDEEGGLQAGWQHDGQTDWLEVEPTPGALVVNTGDIMQVWSNDRYQAALHRVRPMTGNERYSLPYFFNPSYATSYAPLPRTSPEAPRYRTINWGDFRQARADGDFADYGTEVQISQFRTAAED